ncbi:recombinase family protein [Tessaracoccus sp. MC1865]|uniref:recombinase family protein n=1 Tax=Tessaracoccus sp. MC1865 TaxID=2760310 RepID=UPI00160374F6|nr:recombinase family protein [Tessaracoccus sp. MC1865]MBB1482350.1 recombinase family protein [Tessaracoccus sp. MC1865]QTO38182.1 recombinase family protein [Tessaracoccus sp. MC1865]
MTTNTAPRAAIYLRVSLDATGEGLAVDRQREDCHKLAKARGWRVVGEFVDNSISASDAKKNRPGYNALVNAYDAEQFDTLVCWDLDRLTRQPRQLEDWIDRAESRGLVLVTANGEADLGTDGGRMYARIKAAVARAEIERKGARQSRAQRQRAELGRPPAGVRLTGYTRHGEIVPEEAELVRRIFDRFTAGDTLQGIARGLAAEGHTARRGGRWSPSSVSSILKNARYAGRSIISGEVVGEANWPAIVPAEQFDAVQVKLSDPRRKSNHGDTARKFIGSGVYWCTCGLRIRTSGGMKSSHRYTCRHACYYRTGVDVDAYVLAVVRERLSRPDLMELLSRPGDAEKLAALAARRTALQARLVTIEADYDAGLIDGRRFATASDKVRAELADVARDQAALVATEAGTGVLVSADPVAAFDAAPLGIQQRLIDMLMKVTLLPGQRGRKGFDPESVRIEWRNGR